MRKRKEIKHLAPVRPDKTLLTQEVRKMFFTLQESGNHEHESKDVTYFPEEIFREQMGDEIVYFVPTISEQEKENQEKFPLPIFMLEFTDEQKKDLISHARSKGWSLSKKYFQKPKIAISYSEREECGFEESSDVDEDW